MLASQQQLPKIIVALVVKTQLLQRKQVTIPKMVAQFHGKYKKHIKNVPCISVNQCLRYNLGYKQKIIQFIRRDQVYFSSSNVSTDTTVIVKDYMLSEKFTFCFKISIKWNLTKSHATRLK